MESKIDALKRMQKDYTDIHGRVTFYLASHSDPENSYYATQNNNLWTGEANILMYLTQDVPSDVYSIQHDNFYKSLRSVTLEPGLITRHPDPYRFTKWYDPVSLDEYAGVCYSLSVFQESRHEADQMVEYGNTHQWAFIDDIPGTDPFESVKKDGLLLVFFTFLMVLAYIVKTKALGTFDKGTMEKIMQKSQGLTHLSRIRLPKDRLLIKSVSLNSKPTFSEQIWLLLSTFMTTRKSNDETSGKCLAFFKFKALKALNYQPFLVRMAKKMFHKRMKKKYGDNYMEKVFNEYFHDHNHPFHTLIKGLSY
jgi:hypothetical protein